MGAGTAGGQELHWVPAPALLLRAGEVVAANPAAEALLGPAAELLDALPPAARTALLERAAAIEAATTEGGGPPEAEPLLVRLGPPLPLRFADLHLGPHPAGGTVVLVHDASERERLDAVIAEFATGVYLTDEHLRATWIPRRISESTGLSQERFVDSDVYELVHPDDVGPTKELVRQAHQMPGVRCSRPLRVRQFDQPDVWWPIVVHLIWRGDDPAIGGLLVRFDIDTTAGVEVQGTEQVAQALVTLAPSSTTGALHLSTTGELLQRSTRVREILRALGDDADQRWLDLLRAEDRAAVDERLEAARSGTLLPAIEVAFVDAHEGIVVWARLDVLPYRDTHGTVAGMFVNLFDLTSEREARDALASAREELWHLANHDALTGLANRHQLADRLAAALDGWHPAAPVGEGPALIVTDLDRFKAVNDQHGHRIGDEVLCEAARRISAAAAPTDLVCRFGGDEFVVLRELPTSAGELAELVGRIEARFAEPIEVDGHAFAVGISVGGALAEPGDVADPDALVLRADRAMYAAKATRREPR
jgi:diguanylate cyclase (GGDEF)-like protein